MSEIALLGKKIGMTREFYKTGQVVPAFPTEDSGVGSNDLQQH